MSTSIETKHQSNYFDSEEARVAAFDARHTELSRRVPASNLQANFEAHPNDAFPFSGDHLGTSDVRDTPLHREDLGEVVGRVVSTHVEHINIWSWF